MIFIINSTLFIDAHGAFFSNLIFVFRDFKFVISACGNSGGFIELRGLRGATRFYEVYNSINYLERSSFRPLRFVKPSALQIGAYA